MIGDYGLNDVQRKEKRKCSNPKTEADRRVLYKGYPLYLPSEDAVEAFKKAYPDTDNESLRAITGRSVSYNSRLGNYFGLQKSEAFLERRNKNASEACKRNRSKGKPKKGVCPEWLIKTQFGKPSGNKQFIFTEDARKKMSENRKALIRKERMREEWGLPRQTKLNIGQQATSQLNQRYNIRKRGYTEVEFCVFTYNDSTNRSEYYEGIKRYRFYREEEWKNLQCDHKESVTAIRTWEDKQGGFNFV